MSAVHTHSSFTMASFHASNWHDAEPLLETWKSLLQSLPGYIVCDMWIRRLDNGDVRCVIRVTWEYREQLEEFLASQWAPETIIRTLEPQPYDIQAEHLEQHM